MGRGDRCGSAACGKSRDHMTCSVKRPAASGGARAASTTHTMRREAAGTGTAALKRTHSFLFGCTLTDAKREVAFPGGGENLQEQLSLRTVSLGLGAPDELHVLAAQGEGRSGAPLRVPVVTVRPSLQYAVLVGDLDLVPPVTFRLVSGSGPLHVSGQHLVASGRRRARKGALRHLAKARRARVFQDATVQTPSEWQDPCTGANDATVQTPSEWQEPGANDATVQTPSEWHWPCVATKDATVPHSIPRPPPRMPHSVPRQMAPAAKPRTYAPSVPRPWPPAGRAGR